MGMCLVKGHAGRAPDGSQMWKGALEGCAEKCPSHVLVQSWMREHVVNMTEKTRSVESWTSLPMTKTSHQKLRIAQWKLQQQLQVQQMPCLMTRHAMWVWMIVDDYPGWRVVCDAKQVVHS